MQKFKLLVFTIVIIAHVIKYYFAFLVKYYALYRAIFVGIGVQNYSKSAR